MRFSIRTLLIALTVLGCCLGAIAYATRDWRHREQARRELMACGAIYVGFDWTNAPHWVALKGRLRVELANYPTIENVDYAGSPVAAEDLTVISKLPHVRLLDLAQCDLPTHPAVSIGRLKGLKLLRLNGTRFNDADLLLLNSLASLRAVDVEGTLVTLEGIQAFRELRPEVTVRH